MGRDGKGSQRRFRRGISIHSPRMGRDNISVSALLSAVISIHSPRMGRDAQITSGRPKRENFNPLSPHGERLCAVYCPVIDGLISIHSPRMGRDRGGRYRQVRGRDFNPLSPHGERRGMGKPMPLSFNFNPLSPHGERPYPRPPLSWRWRFQSTLPAWGETPLEGGGRMTTIISIHSPRMGRDPRHGRSKEHRADFNPLSPHGERQRETGGASQ